MNAIPPRKYSRSQTSTAATKFSASPVSEIALGVSRDSIRRSRTISRRWGPVSAARRDARCGRAKQSIDDEVVGGGDDHEGDQQRIQPPQDGGNAGTRQ